jgi:quinoprotein glucose dehydrogenase
MCLFYKIFDLPISHADLTIEAPVVFLALAFLSACSPDKKDDPSTWPTFGRDVSNNKFSELTGIDTSNVMQLQEVWRHEDTTEGGGVYFNPVMMNNRVIGLKPSNKLVALDAATGKLLWEFVPSAL